MAAPLPVSDSVILTETHRLNVCCKLSDLLEQDES